MYVDPGTDEHKKDAEKTEKVKTMIADAKAKADAVVKKASVEQ